MAYKKLKRLVKKYLPVIENPTDHRSGFILTAKLIPRIEIDTAKADDTYLFAALTHEFGHYLSWKSGYKNYGKYRKAMLISNSLKNVNILTKYQKLLVLEEERRAWISGIRFVKRREFKVDEDFYLIKKWGLKEYKNYLFEKADKE
jgi:hypothetical protein